MGSSAPSIRSEYLVACLVSKNCAGHLGLGCFGQEDPSRAQVRKSYRPLVMGNVISTPIGEDDQGVIVYHHSKDIL